MKNSLENVVIRKATPDDAEALQAYVSVLFREGLDTIFEKTKIPSIEDERKFIESMNAQENCFVLIVLYGSEVIGMLDFKAYERPQMSHSGIFGMSVAKIFRGQGVGRKILEELFREVEAREKIRRVELQCFTHNLNGIHLYESMGFVHEGRMKQAVRQDEKFVDVLIMAKLWEK